MKIKTILLRLGSEKLIKLIDDDFFKILKLRNKILINQQNLSNIILQVNSEKKLITEAKTRELLIDALKENEANLIGKLFNLNNKNIWKSLKKVNFKKKKNLDLILDVFEIEKNEKKSTPETQEVKQNPLIIQPKYALFSHQIDVLNKVTNLFKKPVKKVLLHMPTGAGKTRTAINLTSNHLKESSKSLIVWLAHTEELCNKLMMNLIKRGKLLEIERYNHLNYLKTLDMIWKKLIVVLW